MLRILRPGGLVTQPKTVVPTTHWQYCYNPQSITIWLYYTLCVSNFSMPEAKRWEVRKIEGLLLTHSQIKSIEYTLYKCKSGNRNDRFFSNLFSVKLF